MERYFNIAGPCNPREHYMIGAMRRIGNDVFSLIARRQYYVIHAARQSGKTTLLLELTRIINEEGKYYALYCSLENAQAAPKAEDGIPAIISTVQNALKWQTMPNWRSFKEDISGQDPFNMLQDAFSGYCGGLDKPLVLFFDEADCLSSQTLITFLRQLRNGYVNRDNIPFIHSLALVGMRNIRDYRDEYRLPEQTLGSASPFNIVKEYMSLRNFTKDEITELYRQHTSDTGQVFEEGAVELSWEETQGQPWLVNAIACEIVEKITGDDPGKTITADMVSTAIQTIILRRDTHFDSLMARLREKRVRRVIEPILIGEMGDIVFDSDDYGYVKDLGLIRDDKGGVEPANPIYAEIMVRTLNAGIQAEMELRGYSYKMPRYLKDNKIDIDYLLSDFQVFWRENSGIWKEKFDYKKAAPQLILQAFFQKVLNGGGQIIREMAAASGRVDLCVIYLGKKYPIELKIRYDEKTYAEGLEQTLAYMGALGCAKGWLVVFDHRKTPAWEEKLFVRKEDACGKTVMIYGC